MHASLFVLNDDLPTANKWKVVVETLRLPTESGKLQFYLLLPSKLLPLTPPPTPPMPTYSVSMAHPTPFPPSVLSDENPCTSSAHQTSLPQPPTPLG